MSEQSSAMGFCVISTQAPFHGQSAREALDVVLVSATYEIPVNLLLMGDGVYQLLDAQDGALIQSKNIASMLSVLPMYEVETIYADAVSLQQRHIDLNMLPSNVTVLSAAELPPFLQQHSRVFNF